MPDPACSDLRPASTISVEGSGILHALCSQPSGVVVTPALISAYAGYGATFPQVASGRLGPAQVGCDIPGTPRSRTLGDLSRLTGEGDPCLVLSRSDASEYQECAVARWVPREYSAGAIRVLQADVDFSGADGVGGSESWWPEPPAGVTATGAGVLFYTSVGSGGMWVCAGLDGADPVLYLASTPNNGDGTRFPYGSATYDWRRRSLLTFLWDGESPAGATIAVYAAAVGDGGLVLEPPTLIGTVSRPANIVLPNTRVGGADLLAAVGSMVLACNSVVGAGEALLVHDLRICEAASALIRAGAPAPGTRVRSPAVFHYPTDWGPVEGPYSRGAFSRDGARVGVYDACVGWDSSDRAETPATVVEATVGVQSTEHVGSWRVGVSLRVTGPARHVRLVWLDDFSQRYIGLLLDGGSEDLLESYLTWPVDWREGQRLRLVVDWVGGAIRLYTLSDAGASLCLEGDVADVPSPAEGDYVGVEWVLGGTGGGSFALPACRMYPLALYADAGGVAGFSPTSTLPAYADGYALDALLAPLALYAPESGTGGEGSTRSGVVSADITLVSWVSGSARDTPRVRVGPLLWVRASEDSVYAVCATVAADGVLVLYLDSRTHPLSDVLSTQQKTPVRGVRATSSRFQIRLEVAVGEAVSLTLGESPTPQVSIPWPNRASVRVDAPTGTGTTGYWAGVGGSDAGVSVVVHSAYAAAAAAVLVTSPLRRSESVGFVLVEGP